MPNQHNDIAVAMAPGRAPLIVAALLQAPDTYPEMRAEDEVVLARVGAIAARWAAQPRHKDG